MLVQRLRETHIGDDCSCGKLLRALAIWLAKATVQQPFTAAAGL